MLLALGLILLTFQIMSGGKFIQPTNMITLAVQASGVAIIATGMVLVIVSRNIDLSVGSLVGLVAMTYALLMTDWLPNMLRHGRRLPVPLGHRPGTRDRPRRRGRSAPGLHHRLRRRALVHRHARRAADDPRCRLVPLERRRRVGPGPHLPADRWRGPGLDRRHPDLGAGHRRLHRDHRAAATAAGNAGGSASRSGRCGRRSSSASSAAWPSSAWPRSPTPILANGSRHPVAQSRHHGRPGGLQSRPGSPSRSSCCSA